MTQTKQSWQPSSGGRPTRIELETFIKNARFTKPRQPVDLQNVNLSQLDLSQADLKQINFYEVNLSGANLQDANLSYSSLYNCNLDQVNLANTNLSYTRLRSISFKTVQLQGANLTGMHFEGSGLQGVDLSGLRFNEAHLNEVDLSGANLGNAALYSAGLRNCNLRQADLTEARLVGADLYKADLADANLDQANLEMAVVSQASYNQATRWPAAFESYKTYMNISQPPRFEQKNTIFVVYSQQDEVEIKHLLTHLKILARVAGLEIDLWPEERFTAQANNKDQLQQAIIQAKAVLLPLSADFLTSDIFIDPDFSNSLHLPNYRLTNFIPIILKPCRWQAVSWIRGISPLPRSSQPIWDDPRRNVDDTLVRVVDTVHQVLRR